MKTGQVVSWNDKLGFGFIRPTGASRDVFVHISGCANPKYRLRQGDEVSFEIVPGDKGDKAINVQVLVPATDTK